MLDCRADLPGRSAITTLKVEQRGKAAHQGMSFSVLDSPTHQSCGRPRTAETEGSLLAGRQGPDEISEINGSR